jgi:hypothetical protein
MNVSESNDVSKGHLLAGHTSTHHLSAIERLRVTHGNTAYENNRPGADELLQELRGFIRPGVTCTTWEVRWRSLLSFRFRDKLVDMLTK